MIKRVINCWIRIIRRFLFPGMFSFLNIFSLSPVFLLLLLHLYLQTPFYFPLVSISLRLLTFPLLTHLHLHLLFQTQCFLLDLFHLCLIIFPLTVNPLSTLNLEDLRDKIKGLYLLIFKIFFCNSIFISHVTDSCFASSCAPTVLSYNALSPTNQVILQSVSNISEPSNYEEACTHACWRKAMKDEVTTLQTNHTWDIVVLPPDRRALPCKWVYKVKQHANGNLERLKTRLVIPVNIQKEGIDCHETFSQW